MAKKAAEMPTVDVSEFNYKDLTGEAFKKYVRLVGDRVYREINPETGQETPIVGELKEDQMMDFSQHDVVVVRKPRYPGVKDTPYDFVGIRIKTDAPRTTTRIPVRTALELNAQIVNAHAIAGHGRYYLLKK